MLLQLIVRIYIYFRFAPAISPEQICIQLLYFNPTENNTDKQVIPLTKGNK